MAKKNQIIPYSEHLSQLKREGAEKLYLLQGPEDYLRDAFLGELKKVCLPDGENDFCFRRIDGPEIDMRVLTEAVCSMPFMTERTMTIVRDFDINKCRDASAAAFERIISDLPEWSTLVFVMRRGYAVDQRLKTVKSVKKYGKILDFTEQNDNQIVKWIIKRFSSLGKKIEPSVSLKLIQTSGRLMNDLIPEIEKIAAGAKGESISEKDVDRYAHHLPEERVFEMTDRIAAKDWNGAAALMAELLASGEDPIKTNAIISGQLQRLYAARLAIDSRLGPDYVAKLFGIGYEGIVRKINQAASRFTLSQLACAIRICAETDYAMKSRSDDDSDLLKLLLCRFAAEAFI